MTDINISEVFGHKSASKKLLKSSDLLLTDDMVGIESELEGLEGHITDYRGNSKLSKYWDVVEDGSLRGYEDYHAYEFVSNEPIFGEDIVESLRQLDNTITRKVHSHRTSVHIHLDVRDMSYNQLLRLVVNYLLVEPILFSLVGETRQDNPFCIPLSSSSSYLRSVGQELTSTRTGSSHFYSTLGHRSGNKYTALNLLPIATQGSIEFRHMKGSCNSEEILTWINIILALKRVSVEDRPAMSIEELDKISDNYVEYVSYIFRDNPIGSDLIKESEYHACLCAKQMLHMSSTRSTQSDEGMAAKESLFFQTMAPNERSRYHSSEDIEGIITDVMSLNHDQIVSLLRENRTSRDVAESIAEMVGRGDVDVSVLNRYVVPAVHKHNNRVRVRFNAAPTPLGFDQMFSR